MTILAKLLVILFIAAQAVFFASWLWPLLNVSPGGVWLPKPGAGVRGTFDPWGLPLLSTLVLLTSGATLTWAHRALLRDDRRSLGWGLLATVLLGVLFLASQTYASIQGAFTAAGSIHAATFFMTAGYHGWPAIVGTLLLTACLIGALAGRFTPTRHLAFEAAAWYWHFVDMV
jgi:cytochrome c oxidase subunit 3